MNEKYNVYLISDSTGKLLIEFFYLYNLNLKILNMRKREFFFVRTQQQVDKIISDGIKGESTIILYTIVETKLAKYLSKKSEEY